MIQAYNRRTTSVRPIADSSDAFSPVKEQVDLSSIDQWVAAFTNGASACAASFLPSSKQAGGALFQVPKDGPNQTRLAL
jgi:hypothetical protein